MKRALYIFSFFIVLLISCTQKPFQQRLAEFINDPENKITQSIKIGKLTASTKWLPYAYRHPVAGNVQAAYTQQDDGYCYFDVRFQSEVQEKPAKEKTMYLDFDMQNDFRLYCAGDSLLPAICQKIENGQAGNYQYLLAFENNYRRLDNNDFALIYNDKIFGIGVIAFVYKQQDVKKIPRLKISKG